MIDDGPGTYTAETVICRKGAHYSVDGYTLGCLFVNSRTTKNSKSILESQFYRISRVRTVRKSCLCSVRFPWHTVRFGTARLRASQFHINTHSSFLEVVFAGTVGE